MHIHFERIWLIGGERERVGLEKSIAVPFSNDPSLLPPQLKGGNPPHSQVPNQLIFVKTHLSLFAHALVKRVTDTRDIVYHFSYILLR